MTGKRGKRPDTPSSAKSHNGNSLLENLQADLRKQFSEMSGSSPDESISNHLQNIRMALKILNYSRKCLYGEGVALSFEANMLTGGLAVAIRVRQ